MAQAKETPRARPLSISYYYLSTYLLLISYIAYLYTYLLFLTSLTSLLMIALT